VKRTQKESKTQGKGKILVTDRQINELRLNPNNPRSHSAKQLSQLARSIQIFGFNVPVLVDAKDNVIAGHGRIMACQQLGWSEVPVIVLEHLSEAQARAFMIADNRLTEISMWDDRLLATHLKELSAVELDFELEAIGFDIAEIDLRIGESIPENEQKEDEADLVETVSDGPAVSRPGDLFLLGDHRVYCGSALVQAAYIELMENARAAMVITDPPYNVRIKGNVSGLGTIQHREFAMASGEMDQAQFTSFLRQACMLLARHSTDGSLHFIFRTGAMLVSCLRLGKEPIQNSKISASGSKTLPAWGRSTAAAMSWSLSSNMAGVRTAIISCSASMVAIALTFGITLVLVPSATKATCSPCILLSSR